MSFERPSFLKALLYSLAVIITVGSLYYSNSLVKTLGEEEKKKVRLYAEAMEFLGSIDEECTQQENCETNFVFDNITKNNELIPTILVDSMGKILGAQNLGIPPGLGKQDSLKRVQFMLKSMRKSSGNKPIEITFYGQKNYVLHAESSLLKKLRLFPYLQLLVLLVFFGILFATFAISKNNEQNRVWVGLAKETAHQLGTPVSSLLALVEILKVRMGNDGSNEELVREFEKDVVRLEVITERFSKIGSKPKLDPVPSDRILGDVVDYMRKRIPSSVSLDVENVTSEQSFFNINQPLFEWVLENLLKNALDAMGGAGQIVIKISESKSQMFIDVSDSGKGMPSSLHKKVFEPGFTTKKRGWGLGLSLTRRIVEEYHKGKIFVMESRPGKGTTFRIRLPKRQNG